MIASPRIAAGIQRRGGRMGAAVWRTRKAVWNLVAVTKFRGAKPAVIPLPQDDEARLSAVPLVSQLPDLPIDNILVADRVPDDEASFVKSKAYDLLIGLYG